MTEDEAKAKWCPWARVFACDGDGATGSANRDDDGAVKSANCLGSGCMAWRWSGAGTGYCGSAGAPTGHGP